MIDIPSQLHYRLHKVLLTCAPFHSREALVATFSDRRISPWHEQIPYAGSPDEQVHVTIDFLRNQYNATHENALALFLQVLRDLTDPGDACYQQLIELIYAFEAEIDALSKSVATSSHPMHLTKLAPAFRITLPLFDRHRFEDWVPEVESSLIQEFEWDTQWAHAALVVLTELVSNAFEHGCQGHGEWEVTVSVQHYYDRDNEERLEIVVESPGAGFDLSQTLANVKQRADDPTQRSGLWYIDRFSDELLSSSDGRTLKAILRPRHREELKIIKTSTHIVSVGGISIGRIPIVVPRIDSNTTPQVAEYVEPLVASLTSQVSGFVFDLQAVTFISSAGLRLLVMLCKQIKETGQYMSLVASERIRDVLDLTGLLSFLPTYDTEEAALSYIVEQIRGQDNTRSA
ncbi:MAG: anti-sigma factor antagonist [Anaerolineae bacterium]|nr:anti-sigma factor antagonist [Anaerolineae bacterium]